MGPKKTTTTPHHAPSKRQTTASLVTLDPFAIIGSNGAGNKPSNKPRRTSVTATTAQEASPASLTASSAAAPLRGPPPPAVMVATLDAAGNVAFVPSVPEGDDGGTRKVNGGASTTLSNGGTANDHHDAIVEGEDGEEVFAQDQGSSSDRDFDEIVGMLEAALVATNVDDVIAASLFMAPSLTDTNDHERFLFYKVVADRIETTIEAEITKLITEKGGKTTSSQTPITIEAIGTLVMSRQHEVHPGVLDMLSGAMIEYEDFLRQWQRREAAATMQEEAAVETA